MMEQTNNYGSLFNSNLMSVEEEQTEQNNGEQINQMQQQAPNTVNNEQEVEAILPLLTELGVDTNP